MLKFVSTDPLIKPPLKDKLTINDLLIKKGTVRSNVLTFKVAGETGRIVTLTPVGP
jgi:hypothetical protein